MRTAETVRGGSPPHTRGKASIILVFLCICRITPAHAGKSAAYNGTVSAAEDHPRTRGEKAQHSRRARRGRRITPAHAGKRNRICRLCDKGKDHPRTRGEKKFRKVGDGACWGSPPHTRGKAKSHATSGMRQRITPAHAGKRSSERQEDNPARDHPRTRGEKFYQRWKRNSELGSPPHTRGKVNYSIYKAGKGRITPAHAGKSSCAAFARAVAEDHPRTRGEKVFVHRRVEVERGSPPHTRGKD